MQRVAEMFGDCDTYGMLLAALLLLLLLLLLLYNASSTRLLDAGAHSRATRAVRTI